MFLGTSMAIVRADESGFKTRDWATVPGNTAERTALTALGYYFNPVNFDSATYDEALKRLEAAGAGAPEGRLSHVAMVEDGKISVFDVWESQAAFEKFGETLLPTLSSLGADPGQPMVVPVHNIIEG